MHPTCPAAHPISRKHRVNIPADSWDCHTHVFGPIQVFPYLNTSKYTPPEAPLGDYMSMLDAMSFKFGVLVQPSTYKTDNTCMLSAMKSANGRLRGVIALEDGAISHAQLKEWDQLGVRGVRVNAALPSYSEHLLESVWQLIKPYGWHISLQVSSIDQMAVLDSSLRRIRPTVIIEAMGKMRSDRASTDLGFQALCNLLSDGIVWTKLSHVYKVSAAGIPYCDMAWIPKSLAQANINRLIWGSDWPHPDVAQVPHDEDLIELLDTWFQSASDLKKILAINPVLLYNSRASGFGL